MITYLCKLIFVTTTLVLLLVACTFPQKLTNLGRSDATNRPLVVTSAETVHVVKPRPRIAQHGHGDKATFARCLPSQCPAVTRKTLAAAPSADAIPPRGADPARAPIEAEPPGLDESVVADSAPERHAPRADLRQSGFEPSTPSAEVQLPGTVAITFEFGTARLSDEAKALIDRAAASWPDASSVVIRGRTDSVGSVQANDALAWARARAVRDHLRRFHPALSGRAIVEARGSCCFAASNKTFEGRAMNRRVEIVFDRVPE